jgi:hypothetical protein
MRSRGMSLTSTTKHVGSTAMAPTKARKPEGKGGGGVQPHESKAIAQPPTKAPKQTLDLKLGTPSKCLIMNLETHFGQMARAKKNFVRCRLVLSCHGTHQGPERTLDLKLGTPSKCLIMNLETYFRQMAQAKKKFVRRRLVLACHGTHQGMPWHPPRPRSEHWI